MKLFVETRGSSRLDDYWFLSTEQPERWWNAYRDSVVFEEFTLLLENQNGLTRTYISGIPSGRVDDLNTVIRYTLVLEPETDDDRDELLRLAAHCITRFGEVGSEKGLEDLGHYLDKVWGEGVEHYFSKSKMFSGTWNDLEQFLRTTGPLGTDGDDQKSWMGTIFEANHRDLFLARLDSILKQGVYGGAHYLSLVENWSPLASLSDPLWILNSTSKDLIAREVPTEKKNVPATNSVTPEPASANTKRILVVAGIAGLLLLMWMLTTDCQQ